MMAFAVLFTGWAFAQDNHEGQPVEEPTVPVYDITLDGSDDGEAYTTGIYKGTYANWTLEAMGGASYFDTPKTMVVEYIALNDDGSVATGDFAQDVTKEYEVVTMDGEVPVRIQFLMDSLFPNTLYKVKVTIEDHESDWMYFISLPASLEPGTIVWNFADYDENADPIEYEYLDATNQAENNGGKIKWQFSEFKHSFSPKTIVPDVTGHVEVYEDDNRVQTRERTTDPFTERSAYQMQAGSWYQVKAYGTYKYNVKVLKETDANGYALSPDVQPYAEVTNEQKEVKSDVVTTMKKQWMGSGLNPNNIHVGPIMEGDEQVATLVAMNHLPADAPDFVMGTLFYKTADMTAFDQVLVNLWPNSNIAEFVVPVAEDFDFYIILVTKVSGNKPNLVEMRKKDGSQIIAHCTMGGANAFDLTDRPLLWGAGQPAYMLPVTENDPSVNRQHYVLEFKRAGGQNSHTVYGAPASINELDEEGNVVSTTNFAKFDLTTTTAALDETTEFEYVKVSVNSHSYLEALKENWQYYTSEGAHIVDLATLIPFNPLNQEEMNNLADILCEGAVFSGNVTPIDPRVGKNDAPLMSVTDPTKPAPLYFFDWAWTPKTAPVIGKIMIEHKDYVKHYTCETMTEWTDTEDEVEFESKISYKLPTLYNNAQDITQLTVREYGKDANVRAWNDKYYNETIVPAEDLDGELHEYTGDWGKKFYAIDPNLYGPMSLYTGVVGEVPEAAVVKYAGKGFTMASREGWVQLGSLLYAVDEDGNPVKDENGNLVAALDENGNEQDVPGWIEDKTQPMFIEKPSLVNSVLTTFPQFVVNNIYNWNRVIPEGETNPLKTGECGQCDVTIWAKMTRTSPITAEEQAAADEEHRPIRTEWVAKPAYGHMDEMGQVLLINDLVFAEVDYDAEYLLEGYMVYTPQRFTDASRGLSYTPAAGQPEVGPIVKVPFSYVYKSTPKTPNIAPSKNGVTYWIVSDKDEATDDHFVEVRIYDPDGKAGQIGGTNTLKLIAELIPNDNMPAPITGKWVDATTTEKGYYSFLFEVEKDGTGDIRETYRYDYKLYYKQGDLTSNVKMFYGDEGINTPSPWLNYVKHDPAVAPDYAPAEKIGAYEDELWPYCRTLKNFFAITEDYLPTKFENYMEYFGIDEAKNLVFNFEMPVVEQHPSAPGRRASEITTVVEKYALVVRLDDKVNDDLGADGYKQNVYFNDVNFKAQSAKYTATFKYANRSLVMPFNADAPEGAKVTCYEDSYMNEAGDEVIFRFTQKKTLGVIDNTITANRPYIIKAKAGDVVFAGEEVAIGLSSDNTTADLSLRIGEELIKCATMTGLYEYKYNGQIVPADVAKNEFYYRYSPKQKIFGELQKPSVADPTVDDYGNAYSPTYNAVKCFECYLYYMDLGYGNAGYSISIRFDDEDDDATMIQNVNVETESSELFDVMGRKVVEPVKGQIYIQNGKKVLF